MSGVRLGNFPLQSIGVRGDSMRTSQPPASKNTSPSGPDSTDADLATRVSDAGWLLARIWKFGEFSGLDAGTPADQGLEKRVRRLVGKVVVIQRLGGASGSEPDIVQIKRLTKVDRLENGALGFWVEGDNTSASTDSRHWGYLKGSEIRGRVIFSKGMK
jgi:hypothetical protein